MPEFTAVDRVKLQKAFALAHNAFEYGRHPQETRLKFKAIADLLWAAHGEAGKPPANCGKEIAERIGLLAQSADKTPTVDKFKLCRGNDQYLYMIPNYYGFGASVAEAKAACRAAGGRWRVGMAWALYSVPQGTTIDPVNGGINSPKRGDEYAPVMLDESKPNKWIE